jgi:hypothetical protein
MRDLFEERDEHAVSLMDIEEKGGSRWSNG